MINKRFHIQNTSILSTELIFKTKKNLKIQNLRIQVFKKIN